MNERIRELADEAAKFSAIMALPTGQSGDELFVEKFAQLIMRETFDWVVDNVGLMEETEWNALKKHFGVECE